MTGLLPETLYFTDKGQPILAVLVKNPPGAGCWTLIEMCAICNQPLEHHPFYATDPLLFYVHAHCLYEHAVAAATAATPGSTDNLTNRGVQSHTPSQHFMSPSYPPATYHPSYSPATQSYTPDNIYYPSTLHPPSALYHYNQYHPPNYTNYHYSPATCHPSKINNSYYSDYPQYLPPSPPLYHYNQYHPPNYTSYHPSPLHPTPSSSSVPGWTTLATTTVMGSLLQAFFSFLFSGS